MKNLLYISPYKIYNKQRNSLIIEPLRDRRELPPSSPPRLDKLNVAVLSLSKGRQ